LLKFIYFYGALAAMAHQQFLQLIARIQTESKNRFEGLQLACITKLVHFCGVLANEVPKLKVGDVIGKDGAINRTIKRGDDREIHLNLAALEAVEHYIADLRQKLPSFMHRKAGLFPSYRNTDKLKRDLKRFDTNCRTIKEAGYFHYYRNEKSEGTRETRIYGKGAEQLRVTDRQFRAVVTGEKIKPGKTVDRRSIEEILGLLEEAERLDKNAHDAGEKARSIMESYEKSLKCIRNKDLRKNYKKVRRDLKKALAPPTK
jgi:hypothetical protein